MAKRKKVSKAKPAKKEAVKPETADRLPIGSSLPGPGWGAKEGMKEHGRR